MIKRLDNTNLEIASSIHTVLQASYKVEAKLLKATDFPPLKRSVSDIKKSKSLFFGYFKATELVGVIQINSNNESTAICSLVILPKFFRQGIARALLTHVFKNYISSVYSVETGTDNYPAIYLYKNLGFIKTKEWDTDFGIRKTAFKKISH